jgi:hypothetical protein
MSHDSTQPAEKERSHMTTRRLMIIEMVVCVIATVILFMALLTFNVQAQELASGANNAAINSLSPQKNGAGVGANASSNNNTKTKAEILKQNGVPGKGIDTAPGLQKPFNPNSSAAEHAGKKGVSDNRTTSISDNRTTPPPFSGNSTNTKAGILKQRGVPGKGIDQAPGLQKQFNPNAVNEDGMKSFIYRWQQRFQEMIQRFSKGTKS